MDTTGTFDMAIKFSQKNMIVAIHKHYSINDWLKFYKENSLMQLTWPSSVAQAILLSMILSFLISLQHVLMSLSDKTTRDFLLFVSMGKLLEEKGKITFVENYDW